MTICRKALKRAMASQQSQPQDTLEEGPSTSNQQSTPGNSGKRTRSGKSAMFPFERQHSQQDEDYDFDYEKEEYQFDEDNYAAAMNSGQIRCPHNGCSAVLDSDMELQEHLHMMHFNMLDLYPTFDCLVEGCTEKFPNLARANVHMRNHHPDAYITCDKCQKQVKAHYLRKHVYMRHRKGEYKCSQDCDFVAEYYHELEKHRYMVHYNRYSWPEHGAGPGSVPPGSGGGLGPSGPPGLNHPNVIAAAIAANLQQAASQASSSASNSNANSEDMSMPPVRFRRFACKWQDCSFTNDSRTRVLKHIRANHLGPNSRNGGSQPPGNPAEDKAALEYLDVLEFGDNSYFYPE